MISFSEGDGWGKNLAAGVVWRVQGVPDGERHKRGGGAGAGGSDVFEKVHKGATFEIDMQLLKVGGEPIEAGRPYRASRPPPHVWRGTVLGAGAVFKGR